MTINLLNEYVMGAISNKSFASKLGNARKLQTILINLLTYEPPLELAGADALADTISVIEDIQTNYNTAKTGYTSKIDARKKVFVESLDSILKRLSPIRAFIEALYGKDSIELKQINTLVKKIRGDAKSHTTNDEVKHISTIESTYASRLSDFNNIIDILKSFGENYNPPNVLLKVESLISLSALAASATAEVETSLASMKPIINARKTAYDGLHQQTQTIKNFVKAQYGNDSEEYAQLKGLIV